jgi:hypothetical protein
MVSRRVVRRTVLMCVLLGTLALLVEDYWCSMTVAKAIQEDEIRVAVLRAVLSEHIQGCGLPAAVCCISVKGIRDPSDAFLAQFNGSFLKASDCAVRNLERIEIKTGRSATIVEIAGVEWQSLFAAELGTSFFTGTSGQGIVFEVHRWGNHWIVRRRMGWVT